MAFARLVFLGLTILGVLYYVLSTYAIASHYRLIGQVDERKEDLPTVTILKPVCGLENDTAGALATSLTQDYPCYDVLFGALEESDESASLLAELSARSPIAAVYTGGASEGANNKVRILSNLSNHTSSELLAIIDADTRISTDWLRRMVIEFSDQDVGAVTCMYRGVGGYTLADKLEGLYMTCIFGPGVACSRKLGDLDYILGAASIIRAKAVSEIGGFDALCEYLADDFQLGNKISKAGYKIVLSDQVVEIVLSGEPLGRVLQRELRWSRTTRVSRPLGHLGLVFTFGFAYATIYWLLSRFSALGWEVFGLTALARSGTAYISAAYYQGDREFSKRMHVLPLRDLLSFGIWIAGYFSNTVAWRDRRLRLNSNGTIQPL